MPAAPRFCSIPTHLTPTQPLPKSPHPHQPTATRRSSSSRRRRRRQQQEEQEEEEATVAIKTEDDLQTVKMEENDLETVAAVKDEV